MSAILLNNCSSTLSLEEGALIRSSFKILTICFLEIWDDKMPGFFECLEVDFMVGNHVIKGTNVIRHRPENTKRETANQSQEKRCHDKRHKCDSALAWKKKTKRETATQSQEKRSCDKRHKCDSAWAWKKQREKQPIRVKKRDAMIKVIRHRPENTKRTTANQSQSEKKNLKSRIANL